MEPGIPLTNCKSKVTGTLSIYVMLQHNMLFSNIRQKSSLALLSCLRIAAQEVVPDCQSILLPWL